MSVRTVVKEHFIPGILNLYFLFFSSIIFAMGLLIIFISSQKQLSTLLIFFLLSATVNSFSIFNLRRTVPYPSPTQAEQW